MSDKEESLPPKKTKTAKNASTLASLGGAARANALTPERKREIAMMGVDARREKLGQEIPKATHTGMLEIAGAEIECAVLDNGKRVLTTETFLTAIGRSPKGKGGQVASGPDGLPPFLSATALKPFMDNELNSPTVPINYRTLGGGRAIGYEASLLPKVCEIYLKARDAEALTAQQIHIAKACELLMRGLATVGIIALVDEATGFQYDRPRRDLEEHLKKFLSESLRRWVRTFPADYFKHLCRLRGVELRSDMKLPQYFGHLTNNLIYRRLAPGLLRRLQERKEERGTASNKLHSWLSADVGFPEVLVHLGTVVGLMKLHTNFDAFEKQLDSIAPPYPETPGLFDDPNDWK